MNELTHDISALKDAAKLVHTDATLAALDVLRTTVVVAAHNDCWGTDKVGGAFAHMYLAPARTTLEAVQASAYQIGAVADKLTETAQSYEDQEEDSTGKAAAMGKAPGPQ